MRPSRSRESAIPTSDGSPPNLHTTHLPALARLDPDIAREWLYAFAIQTLDYALLVVGPDKRILWANSGAAWILAATVSEIVGSSVSAYFTADDVAFGIPEHEQRSALRQGSSDDDRWMVRADGSQFWATGKTVALTQHDGTPKGFFKIFRDQTEFKMRIDALKTKAAPTDADRAQAVPVPGSEQLLLEDEWRAVLAGLDTGNRSINLLFPGGAPLQCDGNRVRLRQAFTELLANAVQATAEDGTIWINGTTEGTQAVVHVEDNGRGIDAATLATLFDVFTRPPELLPAGQAERGLARVRRVVNEHGGAVQVHSPGPGKGSEFTVRLPLCSRSP